MKILQSIILLASVFSYSLYAQDAAKELEASREKAKVVAQTTTQKGGSGGGGEIGFAGRLGKLGGKRKTKKSKRSQKNRKSMKNKHSVRK